MQKDIQNKLNGIYDLESFKNDSLFVSRSSSGHPGDTMDIVDMLVTNVLHRGRIKNWTCRIPKDQQDDLPGTGKITNDVQIRLGSEDGPAIVNYYFVESRSGTKVCVHFPSDKIEQKTTSPDDRLEEIKGQLFDLTYSKDPSAKEQAEVLKKEFKQLSGREWRGSKETYSGIPF